jgi:hypothetical protein
MATAVSQGQMFGILTLSILMLYIYGAPSKARNLTYIWMRFFTGDFAS